jgi:undecaprenyl-diphosphatase
MIMNNLQAVILGVIQGLTEFIPVSSTAHLLIGQKILGIPSSQAVFSFMVIIQLGTILSLVVYFWKDLIVLVKAFFRKPFSTPDNRLVWYILIATLPALMFGYLLKPLVESLFKQPLVEASIRLLITALVLALVEWLGKLHRSLVKMKWWDAVLIGLAQVVSIFPGASRSGTTIAAGMARGFDRPASARFAFLMSIPVMLAAGGYQAIDLLKTPGISSFLPVLAIGFIAAALFGWLAVRWLLVFLGKHKLFVFSIYCAVTGLVCLLFAVI